ncbi:helix-turn-helix domain-containing protein [Aestuariimicrobium ganziense]|uniref:helix-turn-helix domain-containing protein n=1 Tax=Aestuariimicrobium ganziense TaxID=2773677 RepID=UPI001942C706|nr:helix-turn-helix domain-containing protein [Aestuariimicrobium ganziense]
MSGVLADDAARQLHDALNAVADDAAREPFLRLLEVLETSPEVVILPADALLSTQAVADHLGVSRMTVVRLIDRGILESAGVGVHRKVRASEVERYLVERAAKRRGAIAELAQDIDADTAADEVIRTR